MTDDKLAPTPPQNDANAQGGTKDHLFASGSIPRNDAEFKRLTDALPVLVCFVDTDMIYRFANKAYLTWYDLDPEVVVGKHVRDVVGDEGFAMREPFIEAALAGEEISMEVSVPRRDGSVLWGDVRYLPHRNAGGAVDGFYAFVFDVTERRRAEIALQRLNQSLEQQVAERTAQLVASQALISTLYNHSSECHAILEVTEDGRFIYEEVNPATLRLYGTTRERVIGYTTDEILGAQTAAELNTHLTECLRLGGPYQYVRAQGKSVIESVAAPVPDDRGKGRRLVVSARDVTERRNLEEQLRQSQKMEAIGQLTGGIAHDFNNLLQGIIGSLEILQKRIAQGRLADVERFVRSAVTSANRAAGLTHRLLAFSRRQPLDPKPIQANQLITSIEDLLRRSIGEHIAMELVLAAGLWPILCDANQLESALLNLAINARDAMPAGGKLTIETGNAHLDNAYAAKQRDVTPGQYVCISVTDTGTGMTPDVVSRAFDPFFTTKPMGQGTGLGLSMIYGFARQSDGHVKIYTEVGRGTTLKLYLPRHNGRASGEEASAASIAANGAQDGEVVVVAEDEPVVRSLIVDILDELGYRPLEAADGQAALKILDTAERVDLLVTDIGLPGLNGRQVADAARVRRPDLKILFMTGYAENAAIANGILERGMEMMTKPFPIDAMATRIREMIERR